MPSGWCLKRCTAPATSHIDQPQRPATASSMVGLWVKYKYEDEHGDIKYWLHRAADESFFIEGDAAWQKYSDPESLKVYWYCDDGRWFFALRLPLDFLDEDSRLKKTTRREYSSIEDMTDMEGAQQRRTGIHCVGKMDGCNFAFETEGAANEYFSRLQRIDKHKSFVGKTTLVKAMRQYNGFVFELFRFCSCRGLLA